MMNRGVMNRQMFQYGGGVQPMQYGGGGGVAPMQYGGGGPVYMQQGGNPALQAAITAFFDKYGRAPSQEEIAEINAAQQMMMREGVTGPNTVSPAGPRGQGDFVPMPPSMLGPMTTGEEEGAGMLGGFPPPPSQELAPPVQMSPEYFRDMQPDPRQNTFPPRGDMEMDPRNMVPSYRNGGVVIRRQEGGPVIQEEGAGMLGGFAPRVLPPSPEALTDESSEVTKDMLKRLDYIFRTDMYPAPRRLNEVEKHNAYVMMLSEKGFTEDEIRELATNPSGRFAPLEPVIRRQDGGPGMVMPQDMVPGYRNGGVVIRRQGGGPGMVMPQDMASMAQEMPAAAAALPPSEQGVVMEAMAASGTPEMGAMIEQGAQGFGDPETAENYGEMMNMTRGDQAPVEARREELAQLVGPEDAAQTPESVLALLQPVMMMASAPEPTAPGGMPVDGGIGPLAAEQMTTPVQGDMSGGVMSLANTPQPPMQGMV